MPESPCLYARDLPLIAAVGAQTVRTYGLVPDNDRVFATVLESTRLNWIAGFPIDAFGDAEERLRRFRSYALRMRGEKRLIAFALDGGAYLPPEELGAFARRAAIILRETGMDRSTPLLMQPPPEPSFAGGGEDDLFARVSGPDGIESLRPRAAYFRLAGLWGGSYPPSWAEERLPRLNKPDAASPGGLIRLSGTALLNDTVPYSDESWPFELGGTCLCAGGQPARLSFVAPDEVTAQVPPALEPGQTHIVFYRAGKASNGVLLHVSEFSAAGPSGPALEASLRRPR